MHRQHVGFRALLSVLSCRTIAEVALPRFLAEPDSDEEEGNGVQ